MTWISVDEKLPLLYGTVLFAVRGNIHVGRLVPLQEWEQDKTTGKVQGFESDLSSARSKYQLGKEGVTHWMPCPEVPRP